ncbi:sugar phosphate isomerase/epimerase [Paenibacillus albidus]|uniref:sugar phosphate isomerase/epimerase family protein n=1 Tax=Paenibacillus albidus TaxID=2041023 RepID=UPI001BE92928|nr:sugar phosphate isomerase/epimerase [Paenibacillus albidus]MBT2291427.1 sugar phosphate isomerase/epimerase [Paenibacillus albidus]
MQISVFYSHVLAASGQRGLTVAEVLKRIKGFGIDAVELDLAEVEPGRGELREQLAQAGLAVASMYAFFDYGNDPDVESGLRFIDTAEFFGAPKVLAIPGFIDESASPETRDRTLLRMAAALQEMCSYAEQKNIVVTMEDFDDVRAPFATADQLLWFLDRVPQLGCTFDTGNFIYSAEDELEAYAKLEGRIVHVHCKDRALDERNGGKPKITLNGTALYPSPVGSGIIAIEEILKRLKAYGYVDTLAIEHFDAVDQLAYMEQSATWLRARYS